MALDLDNQRHCIFKLKLVCKDVGLLDERHIDKLLELLSKCGSNKYSNDFFVKVKECRKSVDYKIKELEVLSEEVERISYWVSICGDQIKKGVSNIKVLVSDEHFSDIYTLLLFQSRYR